MMRKRKVREGASELPAGAPHGGRTVRRGGDGGQLLAASTVVLLSVCVLLGVLRLVRGPAWDPRGDVSSVRGVHPEVHPHEYRRRVRKARPGTAVHQDYARALVSFGKTDRKQRMGYFIIGPGEQHWRHLLIDALIQAMPKTSAAPPRASSKEIQASALLSAAAWNPTMVRAAFGLRPDDQDQQNVLRGVLVQWYDCFQGPKLLVDSVAAEPDTWSLNLPESDKAWVDYLAIEFVLGCARNPSESLYEGCATNPLKRNKRPLFASLHVDGCFAFARGEVLASRQSLQPSVNNKQRPRHPLMDIIAKYPIRPQVCKGLPNANRLHKRLNKLIATDSALDASLPDGWQPAPNVTLADAVSVVASRLTQLCRQ